MVDEGRRPIQRRRSLEGVAAVPPGTVAKFGRASRRSDYPRHQTGCPIACGGYSWQLCPARGRTSSTVRFRKLDVECATRLGHHVVINVNRRPDSTSAQRQSQVQEARLAQKSTRALELRLRRRPKVPARGVVPVTQGRFLTACSNARSAHEARGFFTSV
jgi:hypothetical protein